MHEKSKKLAVNTFIHCLWNMKLYVFFGENMIYSKYMHLYANNFTFKSKEHCKKGYYL